MTDPNSEAFKLYKYAYPEAIGGPLIKDLVPSDAGWTFSESVGAQEMAAAIDIIIE